MFVKETIKQQTQNKSEAKIKLDRLLTVILTKTKRLYIGFIGQHILPLALDFELYKFCVLTLITIASVGS